MYQITMESAGRFLKLKLFSADPRSQEKWHLSVPVWLGRGMTLILYPVLGRRTAAVLKLISVPIFYLKL